MQPEDKLARVGALRPARKRESAEMDPGWQGGAPCRDRIAEPGALAQLLGATVGKNRYGEHLVVRRWFSSPEPCVPTPHALRLLVNEGPEKTTATYERLADPSGWLFLDTETTGLAGGTGTYAFLVGLAWWEAGGLQVEQIFMRDHSEEFSLLLNVSRRLAERSLLVTFNGKSFDWPLLETRFRMTRAITPPPPFAHLDLLHPARQLWRLRLGSVRLIELERHVLGADDLCPESNGPQRIDWSRRDDIDAALIPQIYFDYLRGGPIEPLVSVFRHNQMDLRGLAALAAKILTLLAEPDSAGRQTTHPLDLYGLSRLFHRRGDAPGARQLYQRALGAGLPRPIDRAARRELALLAKRERDYALANSLWEEQIRSSARLSNAGGRSLSSDFNSSRNDGALAPEGKSLLARMEAYEELAIYYEHHARQLSRAAQFTRRALADLREARRGTRSEAARGGCPEVGRGADYLDRARYHRLEARFEHRLARLSRKSSRPIFEPAAPEAHGRQRESN